MGAYQPLVRSEEPDESKVSIEEELELELSAHLFLQELIEAGQVMGHEPCPDLVSRANSLFADSLHPEADQMIELYKLMLACEARPSPRVAFRGADIEGQSSFYCPTCAEGQDFELGQSEEIPVGDACCGCGDLFAGVILNPQGETKHHTLRLGGMEIDVWWRSKHPEALSQDQCVVEQLADGRVRVAVIDGVTPAAGLTPSVSAPGSQGGGVNGASYAASVVRSELRKGGELSGSLEKANSRLQAEFAGDGLYSRALPQATAVAFDIYPDGRIQGVRGGTDQAYSLTGTASENLFPGPINDPQAADDFRRELAAADAEARRANPSISQQELQREVRFPLEEKHYQRDNWWGGAAIGRFDRTKLLSFEGRLEDGLVICSDGAHIDKPEEEYRLRDLSGWMGGGLESLESAGQANEGHASDKKTDDVTVIRVRRA